MDNGMTIAYLSDIHTDYKANLIFLREVIQLLIQRQPDLFILAGDISHHEDRLITTLAYFRGLTCPKLVIPGNHDIWSKTETTSFEKHDRILPLIFSEFGWHWLPTNPYRINDSWAIAGTLGWYDYSFAAKVLRIPPIQYRNKIHQGLMWMDGRFAKWERDTKAYQDHEVLAWCLEHLESDLDQLFDVPHLIGVSHHIPYEQLLFRHVPLSKWAFFRAYMGTQKIGNTFAKHPGLEHMIYGHRHYPIQKEVAGVQCHANPLCYPRERSEMDSPESFIQTFTISG
jgi:predicted phosphohydrolase